METKKENQPLLQQFLKLIEQIPTDLVNAALKASDDEDEKTIINAFAPALTNQFKEISSHIMSLSANASKQKLLEAEKILTLTSGVPLASNLKMALPSIGSIVGKLGIDGIIKEIKKIIDFLLTVFHVVLPVWVKPLINLIDEIIADILGLGSIKMKTALSQAEQNYLAELTHLERLKNVSKESNTNDDED